MDPEQRTAILDAVEASFAQQGVTDMYAGAQRLTSFLDRMRIHIAAAHSRESLDAYLASLGPMDEQSFQQMTALFLGIGPLFQDFLLNAAQETVAAQPRKVGPPVRITPQQKRAVIEYIGGLYLKGVPKGDCQRRAAQQFALSFRSVQRIWQERGRLAEQPFLSMDDVWKFFAK